jgi:hypothetical protein
MKLSKTAKKDIKDFLRQMMLIHKLTKEDLRLMEQGVTLIYKQGVIDGLKYNKENL